MAAAVLTALLAASKRYLVGFAPSIALPGVLIHLHTNRCFCIGCLHESLASPSDWRRHRGNYFCWEFTLAKRD
eukprot:2617470-Amphidinium_carterae.1